MRSGMLHYFILAVGVLKWESGYNYYYKEKMSGLTANQAFKDAFARLKNKESRYFIARIDGSEIVIENEGPPTATFEDFKGAVPKEEPRFLLYDYEKKMDDG